ncbi:MAG: extracellular solute-binding protein [Planctomycetota bacterium]|nr:MAG: extracellular solute-binding protein [Planctomycetota bacterium]
MNTRNFKRIAGVALLAGVIALAFWESGRRRFEVPQSRSEVVFWHFWGGKDRPVVEEICRRFNESQQEYFVRPVAMPGNNLDLKFFLSVAGGDPPDVLNQDDPIVADWAHREALLPLDAMASPEEIAELEGWLFPAARQIGSYQDRLYALCNGLDIRALYYNGDLLAEHGLAPPQTLAELDAAALAIAPPGEPHDRYGYLPDPRRLWSWGIVFGGRFYDPRTGVATADSEPIVAALDWMASYSRRYGPDQVARFRKGDQALPGAAFPLLEGRYAMIMDGQWRVAEIAAVAAAAAKRGEQVPHYGVVPLPPPPSGVPKAGWVNGNFFVVPRGARNPQGAWAFMKFWSGFDGHEGEAARACAGGGWIPASQAVVDHPTFQDYLRRYPLFGTFVELASSPEQVPTPGVPGAQFFQDEVIRAAEDAMYKLVPPRAALENANRRVQARLEAARAKE